VQVTRPPGDGVPAGAIEVVETGPVARG